MLALVGVAHWWPDADRVDKLKGSMAFSSEGTTYETASVTKVEPRCTQAVGGSDGCGRLHGRLDEGPERGTAVTVDVPPEVADLGLTTGSRIQLLRQPAAGGQPAAYSYFGIQRDRPLWLLAAMFALVVVAVARLRGLMALVGLVVAAGVVGVFMLPAVLSGHPVVPVAIVAAVVIMYVVLYTTHGLSLRTSVALGGTLAGVGLTALAAWYSVGGARLTGVIDEAGATLVTQVPALSLQRVLIASVVIAGLGALNDVTITQASATWELRAAAPQMGRVELFRSSMRIGRDHVASTIYTLAFAYVGSALVLLLAVQLYDRPLLDLLGTEEIASEIVRSLAGGIGLVLAMPITTALATAVVPGPRPAP
ncbi:YibE/F family protein [Nocardioides terrae]|uniref:YibE/F family protein n=1 Tax=Nocardioides terrae TaxID=574651 RepID=UPI001FE0B457|nr:YibE/F family protein [Nocardioides terrae]